jgi:hypothetical protein
MNLKLNHMALLPGPIVMGLFLLEACNSKENLGNYQGKPFGDQVYQEGAQAVPGKLQCEYYDFGGEGTKYTIDVETEGNYQLGLMFTSNQNGKISFSVDDMDVTGPVTIPSTYVEADMVAFRQWHHWNYIDNLAKIQLKKGIHTFTIHTVDIGQMNYDYIKFELTR